MAPDCPWCGSWRCAKCRWRKRYARLDRPVTCIRCGSTEGTMTPSLHESAEKLAEHRRYAEHGHRRSPMRVITRVPTDAVADLIEERVAEGWTLKAISRASGLSMNTLGNIRHRRRPTIQEATAELVTSACSDWRRLADATQERWIPNIATSRKMQALAALGWTDRQIAARAQVWEITVAQARRRVRRTIDRHLAERLDEVYEQLWDKHPPMDTPGEKRTVAYKIRVAKEAGYVPPMGWDDEMLMDPDATPYRSTERTDYMDVDDLIFLINSERHTYESLAQRFEVHPASVREALRRAGRKDLQRVLEEEQYHINQGVR